MIPIIPLILRIRMLRRPLKWLRCRLPGHAGKLLLLPAAGVFLACSSCEPASPPKPPPVPVTDTRPVGEGLKVIGFALLGAAVVGVLGRMLK